MLHSQSHKARLATRGCVMPGWSRPSEPLSFPLVDGFGLPCPVTPQQALTTLKTEWGMGSGRKGKQGLEPRSLGGRRRASGQLALAGQCEPGLPDLSDTDFGVKLV